MVKMWRTRKNDYKWQKYGALLKMTEKGGLQWRKCANSKQWLKMVIMWRTLKMP